MSNQSRVLIKLESLINNLDTQEIRLINELSHEISNFKTGFKGLARKTLVLSPWASSLFGIELFQKKIYLGAPELIYEMLSRSRIYSAYFIKGRPGLFLVMESSNTKESKPIAIRIHVRSARIESLSKFKKITIIRMNSQNTATVGYDDREFTIEIKEAEGLIWE